MRKLEISDDTFDRIKDQLNEKNEDLTVEIGQEVMMRTHSAGVFMGTLKNLHEKIGVLTNAIRIHYWDGACSLSQLAMEGTKNPGKCRFAIPVTEVLLNDVIEIIAVTSKAKKQIKNVPSWKK